MDTIRTELMQYGLMTTRWHKSLNTEREEPGGGARRGGEAERGGEEEEEGGEVVGGEEEEEGGVVVEEPGGGISRLWFSAVISLLTLLTVI